MENPTLPQKSKPNFVIWIAAGLVTLTIGIGIGLAVGKYSLPFVSPLTSFPTATPTETVDPTANWKAYVNYKENISFNYPQNWTQREYDKERVVVGDDQTVSVTIFFGIYSPVAIETPTPNKIIEEWFKYNIGSTAQFPDGGKVLSKDTIKVSGLDATKYILVNNAISPSQSFQRTWIFVPNNNRVTLLDSADNKLFDQILSTFKFTGTTPTVIPAANKNITNFYYKLPDGWKTVRDETGSFEVGYDPNTTTTSLTYSPGAISIFIKGNIGGAAMSVHLKNYDGGSRHQFIYKFMSDNQPPQKQDLGSDYNEKEYLYNNKSCLFLRGIYTSQFPNIWGMCDAGSGKAFLITSYVPDYETTLQTIRLLK